MQIWGYKTVAMFDIWSLEHFVNGIALAGFAVLITGKLFKKEEISEASIKIVNFIIVLTVSLLWECIEHYVEAGVIPGAIGERVTFWFQGVEHWSNRLIGDTLTVMLGWFVYTKTKRLAIPAKIFTTVWMLIHIFVFPDSMYLHRLIFGPYV
ncbi:MAG: hypothetical protein LBI14_08790 [Treponema sp.]|nr:hypothetical protein [Treponema sp.]